MATDTKQRQAAKAFAAKWSGKGYEKVESQPFWIELLQKVHRANNAAVLEAYGFPKGATESEIVARLFKMYQELIKSKQ